MENYLKIDGKKIELSEETIKNLKQNLIPDIKETASDKIAACSYSLICNINWHEKKSINK